MPLRAAGALVVLVAVQLSVPGLYLPPVFKLASPQSAPDDHFAASPHCRVPARAAGAFVVLVAVQLSVLGLYLPPVFKVADDIFRPRRSFRCRSTLLCVRLGLRARWWCWWPSNCRCSGLYLPPVFNRALATAAPDDHFAASPHCRVRLSGIGRIGGAGGCPTVGAGIVSSAGVQIGWYRQCPPQTIISLPVHTAV